MSKTHKILIIEDNSDTRDFLIHTLKKKFDVLSAEDAVIGIEFARNQSPDLIILDIMMPHLNGLDACKILKQDEKTAHIPIIFLSAKSSAQDITQGLELGADDYIPKPFDQKEFIARITARLRELEKKQSQDSIVVGNLRIQTSDRIVKYKQRIIELTLTEFDILRCLASNVGQPVSRQKIIDFVWANNKKDNINDRTIDVHIRAIRKKIPEMDRHLTSIYGVGYRYDA